MGCGCGGSKNRATNAATSRTTAAAPAAAPARLWEVVKDGRVIFRTRDEAVAISRRGANPGSHYRPAGTTEVR